MTKSTSAVPRFPEQKLTSRRLTSFFAYPPKTIITYCFGRAPLANQIMYSYQFGNSFGAAQSVGDAETNQAPAAADALGANGNQDRSSRGSNATNNTIWFLDPTTLGN